MEGGVGAARKCGRGLCVGCFACCSCEGLGGYQSRNRNRLLMMVMTGLLEAPTHDVPARVRCADKIRTSLWGGQELG